METVVQIFNMSMLTDKELLDKYFDNDPRIEMVSERKKADYILLDQHNDFIQGAVEEREAVYRTLAIIGREAEGTPLTQSIYETLNVLMIEMQPQLIFYDVNELVAQVEEMLSMVETYSTQLQEALEEDDW